MHPMFDPVLTVCRDGQSPLHLASAWGQEEVVQKLIECNAQINSQDSNGQSALHISIR